MDVYMVWDELVNVVNLSSWGLAMSNHVQPHMWTVKTNAMLFIA